MLILLQLSGILRRTEGFNGFMVILEGVYILGFSVLYKGP